MPKTARFLPRVSRRLTAADALRNTAVLGCQVD